MDKKQIDERAHELAAKIYVELVGRNTELTQDSVKLNASATNMASLSLRLAEAFLQAEEAAIVAREPVKKHTLHGDDIASWGQGPTA